MATLAAAPAPTRISFADPRDPRSSSNGSSEEFDPSNPEDHYEDWSKTTSEKDSWAYRERRRNSKFSTFDGDMAIQSSEKQARSRRTPSTVLGIFQEGLDNRGKPSILSDDHHDDIEVDEELLNEADSRKSITFDERRLSMSVPNDDKRLGSILSLWKSGKDKDGNDHIHAGHEGDDWDTTTAVSVNDSLPESVPTSPSLGSREARDDRRGSILSIWKQGKDRSGNAVIHSGEAHDPDMEVSDDGAPLEKVVSSTSSKGKSREGSERHGSILSIWSQGKDKNGNAMILSGEQPDEVVPVPVEIKVESPRGQERRGSILSLWTEGRERDEYERPGKVILSKFDEEDEH